MESGLSHMRSYPLHIGSVKTKQDLISSIKSPLNDTSLIYPFFAPEAIHPVQA